MKDFLDELDWRGLLNDATPGLADRLSKGPITAYVGFDPTSASLQVGNLVPVMLLAHLQRAGGAPIVLLGGGTGLIGDPSGKRSERPLLADRQVEEHVARQRGQFERFFDFDQTATGARMLNNATWLKPVTLVEFLRDVGKHFTLSLMLQKESVKNRLEEGISFTEFSYMLLQAYDFLQLFRTERCELQMGGSDQWGNITAGVELIRRTEGAEAHALSAPLLTTSRGQKFGKSEGGAVWLDKDMTPPHAFYNFWVSTDDRDVERFLKMFTFKTRDEINALLDRHRAEPAARIPHHALASDVTERVHGSAHVQGVGPKDTVEHVLETVPRVEYQWSQTAPPKYEDLFLAAGLASSRGDVRRLLAGGGLYVITDDAEFVPRFGAQAEDACLVGGAAGQYVLLRRGKKTYKVLSVEFV